MNKKHHNLSSLDERCSAENVRRTLKKSQCCGRLRLGDVLMLLAIAFSPLSVRGGAIHNRHFGKLTILNYIFLRIGHMDVTKCSEWISEIFSIGIRRKTGVSLHFRSLSLLSYLVEQFSTKSTSGLKDQSFSGQRWKSFWCSYVLCFNEIKCVC